MTNSTRIPVQAGQSFDATRPLTLEAYVSEQQWHEFRTAVDRAWNDNKEQSKQANCVMRGGFLLGFILFGTGESFRSKAVRSTLLSRSAL